jgi:hypothetical protein
MERHIAEHGIERRENFKENGALRAGENDYNANGDERYDIFEELPSEREEIPTWPNPAWQLLGFRRQKFLVNIEKLRMEHNWTTHPSLVVELYTGRAASAARRLVRR